MTHRTQVHQRTVRKAEARGVRSAPLHLIAAVTEWSVVCDRCGVIEKAADQQTASARAKRHEEMPHR